MAITNQNVRLIDVAQMANVSRSSVAQVLLASAGKNVRVGKDASERIRKAAKELNYQPNMAARQLKGMRSRVIGVIIDSCAPQIAFDRLSAMERTAHRRGYRFMVGQSHGEISHLKEYASDFLSRGVDGVICISHDYPGSGAEIADIYSHFKNIVFIGKPASGEKNLCYIEVDIADGIKHAFDHLKNNDKLPASLLLSNMDSYKTKERLKGFIRAHEEAGIEYDESFVYVMGRVGDNIESIFFKEAVEHLVSKVGAKSIIALNDVFAVHTINALTRMGLSVPSDVAVIGCDNINFASMFNPSLTTIDQEQEQLSALAVDMLLDMIEDGDASMHEPKHVVLKPQLVIRESA